MYWRSFVINGNVSIFAIYYSEINSCFLFTHLPIWLCLTIRGIELERDGKGLGECEA